MTNPSVETLAQQHYARQLGHEDAYQLATHINGWKIKDFQELFGNEAKTLAKWDKAALTGTLVWLSCILTFVVSFTIAISYLVFVGATPGPLGPAVVASFISMFVCGAAMRISEKLVDRAMPAVSAAWLNSMRELTQLKHAWEASGETDKVALVQASIEKVKQRREFMTGCVQYMNKHDLYPNDKDETVQQYRQQLSVCAKLVAEHLAHYQVWEQYTKLNEEALSVTQQNLDRPVLSAQLEEPVHELDEIRNESIIVTEGINKLNELIHPQP